MNDTLDQSALFQEFTGSEKDRIARFLQRRVLAHGEFLIREGSGAQSLFIIESGAVDVMKQSQGGSDSHIGEVTRGSIIGEIAFFEDRIRSADVVARGPVNALELSFDSLERLIAEDLKLGIRLYRAIAASLIAKLKRSTTDLTELVASSRLIALGEMAASIAHEIGNPLTTIQTCSMQIRELTTGKGPDPEYIRNAATSIDAAVGHIAGIVRASRIIARDAQKDELVTISARDLIESSIRLCTGRFKHSDARVSVVVETGCGNLHCRSAQISQVLLNLLSNSLSAIEALPERWVRVEAKNDGGSIAIAVIDSGTGIAPELREKIFQPFFTTKPAGEGTGIGLSISRKIIESHRGELFLDAGAANTCFVLRLPKA
jgi:C4-dicarboxylate-specific signal transduction histidine kinase